MTAFAGLDELYAGRPTAGSARRLVRATIDRRSESCRNPFVEAALAAHRPFSTIAEVDSATALDDTHEIAIETWTVICAVF